MLIGLKFSTEKNHLLRLFIDTDYWVIDTGWKDYIVQRRRATEKYHSFDWLSYTSCNKTVHSFCKYTCLEQT